MYDFIVIGTVKGGTTTLHHLLADHPNISLPAGKEEYLFLSDVTLDDVREHARRHTKPGNHLIRGKVSPLYMCKLGVPQRIHRVVPKTKLIAILRDPVERARSHWRMGCRFGPERRSFADVVRCQLDNPDRWRQTDAECDGYVAYGEYARILGEFRAYFPADQLLTLTTADLERDPRSIVAAICSFLGVEAHVPRNLGQSFNVAERSQRDRPFERLLWGVVPYRVAVNRLGPHARQRAGAVLDAMGVSRPRTDISEALDCETLAELRAHYTTDAASLSPDISVNVWNWS